MEDDTALVRYLLDAADVACVQVAAFGSSPHIRISFALNDSALTEAIVGIRTALSALFQGLFHRPFDRLNVGVRRALGPAWSTVNVGRGERGPRFGVTPCRSRRHGD
jgi:hypothetical protein